MTQQTTKVTAYITCEGNLLVFNYVDVPEAGIQVPAGSVDEGESLDKAVLREAFEETGLENLSIEAYLGDKSYNVIQADGKEINVQRYYYHLSFPGPISVTRWQHWEMTPSEGSRSQVLFELFWTRLSGELPALTGSLGDKLHLLLDKEKTNEL